MTPDRLMTPTIGFECPPLWVRGLVEEAAVNLHNAANELDALLHGDTAALEAIEHAEHEGDRIVYDLVHRFGASRRYGPDRERMIAIARGLDEVLDHLGALAWSWQQRSVIGLLPFLLGVRDVARAGAMACRADPKELPARLERSLESETDARRLSRDARVWLLTVQQDPAVAIAGTILTRHADRAVRAAARLRGELRHHAHA